MADNRDVIEVLTHDHREVEEWFQQFDRAAGAAERQQLVHNIIIELVRHAEAEEQIVYPTARRVVPNGDEVIDREIAEHKQAEQIMNRLDGMSPWASSASTWPRRSPAGSRSSRPHCPRTSW
jgi:hemerythrin superfamily protein